jgi:alpha-N-arabinofuranosidase
MKTIRRREFLGAALAGSAALLANGKASNPSLIPRPAMRAPQSADSRIEVLINEPIGKIMPDIYGHFAEHLGGVVYDGVWVGENSKIPNIGGIRKELVEHMRRIKPPVVRWPGGCFADSYDWRDGVGPRARRPVRTNFWADSGATDRYRAVVTGPQKYDPNQFGTSEFISFCKLIGAQPYLAANVRSQSAKDFYEWVDYCNAPAGSTTLAKLREGDGDREPFGVRFWGIGNESWGCGGNFTPEEYATEFRRFTAWVPRYGTRLAFIGAGPNGGDIEWTRRFFSKLTEKGKGLLNSLYGWAMHYYCGTTGKGIATEYSVDEWYDLLNRASRIDALITRQWAAMGEIDNERRVKLIIDEWGAWHKQSADMPDSYLFGYPGTLRDALVAGLTLDTFNRHADKVVMANVAQLINTIHSLFVAAEDKFVVTPNFHVFEMYAAHQGGASLRTLFSAPGIFHKQGEASVTLWGLAGSASLHDKQLVLTVVNPHASEARESEIATRGAAIKSCQARTLTAADIHAHNSFASPRALEPKDEQVSVSSSNLVYRFAPASVTRLQMTLA